MASNHRRRAPACRDDSAEELRQQLQDKRRIPACRDDSNSMLIGTDRMSRDPACRGGSLEEARRHTQLLEPPTCRGWIVDDGRAGTSEPLRAGGNKKAGRHPPVPNPPRMVSLSGFSLFSISPLV